MTVPEIQSALKDIQRRIYAEESPGSRRVSKSLHTLKLIEQQSEHSDEHDYIEDEHDYIEEGVGVPCNTIYHDDD